MYFLYRSKKQGHWTKERDRRKAVLPKKIQCSTQSESGKHGRNGKKKKERSRTPGSDRRAGIETEPIPGIIKKILIKNKLVKN